MFIKRKNESRYTQRFDNFGLAPYFFFNSIEKTRNMRMSEPPDTQRKRGAYF
jgi:hypothetical protein